MLEKVKLTLNLTGVYKWFQNLIAEFILRMYNIIKTEAGSEMSVLL